MRSIYEQALGDRFKLLHPRIQERFGVNSKDQCASIGRGVMDEIWRGRFFTLPFLYVGSWRRIMFPESGHGNSFHDQKLRVCRSVRKGNYHVDQEFRDAAPPAV